MEEYALLNIIRYAKSAPSFRSTIQIILKGIQRTTGFECVGIRIMNEKGDYPYFEYLGFSDDFVETENSLCQVDEKGNILCDREGMPVLECMCGNIVRGRFNSGLPFFTKGGSFWTNSTTKLLAYSTEEDRQSRTRNRCNGEGYESVGLFPLKYFGGFILGVLQFNDQRKNLFSKENIREYELAAELIGEEVYSSMYFKHLSKRI